MELQNPYHDESNNITSNSSSRVDLDISKPQSEVKPDSVVEPAQQLIPKVPEKSKPSQAEVTISEPQTAHFSQPPTLNTHRITQPNTVTGDYSKGPTSNSAKSSPIKTTFNPPNNRKLSLKLDTNSNSTVPGPRTFDTSPSTPLMLTEDFLEKLHSDLSLPPAAKFTPHSESPKKSSFDPTTTASRPPSETSATQGGIPLNSRKPSVASSLRDTLVEGTSIPKLEDTSINRNETKRGSISNSSSGHNFLTSQSKRKNAEFHGIFSALPLDEILIADYGCALQKGTLVQGRMYLTKSSVSFHSNFFGWVNRISIPLTELVCIEKRHVAYVIPSAIQVATLHHKYVFTSFRNRDSVLIQLNTLWKEAKSSSEAKACEALGVPNDTGNESEESEYEQVDFQGKPPTESQASPLSAPPFPEEKPTVPDKCSCTEGEHLDTVVLETRFKASPSDIYELIYGENSQWLLKFLKESVQDVVIEPWDGKCRKITYVKPLSNPLGPRSTRCVVSQKIISLDLPNGATMLDSVESLDVPSGSAFRAKVRVCIMGDGNGGTKLLVTGGSEWFKSSWIKGAIEKGITDGNSRYFCDLEKAISNHLGKPVACEECPPQKVPEVVPVEKEIPAQGRLFAAMVSFWDRTSHSITWSSYRLGLVFLAVSLCISNIINWNRATGLEHHLKLLQAEYQAPFDPPTLEEALDEIVRFANSLHRSVSALDQHIELVVTRYASDLDVPSGEPDPSPHLVEANPGDPELAPTPPLTPDLVTPGERFFNSKKK